jgi:hypothetical protein
VHVLDDTKPADYKIVDFDTMNSSATDRKPADCQSANGHRTDCDCANGQRAYGLGSDAFRPKAEVMHLAWRLGAGRDLQPIVNQSAFTGSHLIVLGMTL